MSQTEIQEIFKLSRDEKIELVQLLWDDIAKDTNSLDLLPPQIEELDRRLERINNGNAKFKPWEEIKNKYQKMI